MLISSLHNIGIKDRRIDVLSNHLSTMLPERASILDVGSGGGEIALAVSRKKPHAMVTGIDVLIRQDTRIPINQFDGHTIPYGDDSFDYLMFVDVLHHTVQIPELLNEAKRVCRKGVVIKDHYCCGLIANQRLALMDYVGNREISINNPHNYLTQAEWNDIFDKLGLTVSKVTDNLDLYPWPLSIFFGGNLNFIALLTV